MACSCAARTHLLAPATMLGFLHWACSMPTLLLLWCHLHLQSLTAWLKHHGPVVETLDVESSEPVSTSRWSSSRGTACSSRGCGIGLRVLTLRQQQLPPFSAPCLQTETARLSAACTSPHTPEQHPS